MTFALFLGAGNIIFPPSAGLAAGQAMWSAALGFLLTGVGLPLLTVVALARVGGGMAQLTAPLGRSAGLLFAVTVYLAIGPLFATPRTAVVSFEMGIAPLLGDGPLVLALYSLVYFLVVLFLALNPGRLLERVGKLITPVLLLGLLVLGGAALFAPAGEVGATAPDYQRAPLMQGFLQGYLTMDTLGALVFGIVIATAIRDHGVQILTAYVQHTFGTIGSLLLALVITLACLTTAVGLVTACGEFFSSQFPVSYRTVVTLISLFSLLVANLGLTQLIGFSVPVLVGLYPLAIVRVLLSLADGLWLHAPRVFRPVMAVTLVFGVFAGLGTAGLDALVPGWLARLPLAEHSLGWLLPVLVTLLLAVVYDRLQGRPLVRA
jgi:LIVCS family branched-chain amino acid:cation transporter